MTVTKGIIVKEFIFNTETIEHPIYGRIIETNEIEDFNYRWEISHYYRPTQTAAGVYRPSKIHTRTQKDAEQLLTNYAQSFTNIDVTPSNFY